MLFRLHGKQLFCSWGTACNEQTQSQVVLLFSSAFSGSLCFLPYAPLISKLETRTNELHGCWVSMSAGTRQGGKDF